MVASLDPSNDVRTDEDKRVTDSYLTTKSTNDDDDDDDNNNNNLKQERVIDEGNSSSFSPAYIQNSNGNSNGISNGAIPFIPKKQRKKILLERNKLRTAETQTKSLNQQNTALNVAVGGPPGTGTPPTTSTSTSTSTSGANVMHAQENTAAAAQPSISSNNNGHNSKLNSFEIAHLSVVFVCQTSAIIASKYVH
jgi:hypothetical protein